MKKFALFLILSSLFSIGLLAQPVLVEVLTTDVSCNGISDGSASIRITGGSSPYTYTIFYGGFFYTASNIIDTFYSFTNIEARTWNVLVEDSNNDGFSLFKAATVKQPAPISITGVSIVPISCTGAADALVVVTAEGESESFNFELNPGGLITTSGNFSPLGPGTYTITVTDATGCLSSDVTDPILISEQPLISILSESSTDATCYQAENGTISVTAGGGTPPFSYTLNPGALATNGTGNFTGVGPGSYTIEVTDVNNCLPAISNLLTITEPDELLITSATATGLTCNGSGEGAINVTVTGGTAPYQYTLSPGNISNNTGSFTGLGPGSYTVSVTDANACGPVVTSSLTVDEPGVISITDVASDDISCNGANDAEIRITATGGTAPLSYTLNPGSVTQAGGTFSSLSEGSYTVTVTDANACPPATTSPIVFTNPEPVIITGEAFTNITCNGEADGSITLTATGGTGTLTYTLQPGSISNTTGFFNGLGAGSYTVAVTDVNNCLPATSNPLTITEPNELLITSVTVTDLPCNGSGDGVINVTAIGGTAPYQYTLSPGNISNNTGSFTGLGPGSYTVSVTDANACGPVVTSSLTIDEPEVISITGVASDDISCNGANDAEIRITATGGTAPLAYTLNPGSVTQAGGIFSNLSEGSYTVTVTDANACPPATTSPIVFTNPEPVIITGESFTNISCNGEADGSITLTATGGTGTLTYTLQPGSVSNNTGFFNGLGAGSYTLSIEDENSCPPVSTGPITILEPSVVTASVLPSSKLTLECNGDNDGSINISITGGISPYITSWTGPAGYTSSLEDISSLAAGNYSLNITDANSCMASPPLVVSVTVPPALAVSLSKTDATCFADADGTITAAVSGGTPNYEYSLDGISYQISNVFTGLLRNSYTVHVRDANLCISTRDITVSSPPELLVTNEIVLNNNKCYGDSLGEIQISGVEGGVLPYVYSIDGGVSFHSSSDFLTLPAGSYQTMVQDATGCTAYGDLNEITQPEQVKISDYSQTDVTGCFGNSNGQISLLATGGTGSKFYSLDGAPAVSSGLFSNIGGGTHQIRIGDSNQCVMDTFVTLLQPEEIRFTSLAITNITTCFADPSGEVAITASGGTGILQYAIDAGSFGPSGTFTGLPAGLHTLSVRDENSCSRDTSISLSEPPALVILDATSSDSRCAGSNDGSITITASGGNSPYTFSLLPGGTSVNNGLFSGLAPGDYTVEVDDTNGCGPVTSSILTVSEPLPMIVDSLIFKEITCNGANDGEISIYSSAGTPPLLISLDDGVNYAPQTEFTGLAPGIYRIFVKDDNDCILPADTIILTDPPALTLVSLTQTDLITCYGDPSGEIVFEVTGGTGTIEYSIDNGASWQDIGTFTGLTGGDYSLLARDVNACILSPDPISISQPSAISADFSTTPAIDDENKGSITISNAAGGTGNLEFSINGIDGPFSTEALYTELDAGLYPVVIRDESGCLYEENVIVNQIIPLEVTISVTHITCFGYNDGSISISVGNATGQAEYSIDGGSSWTISNLFVSLDPGNYEVWVRDEEDRYFTDEVVINEPAELSIFRNVAPATCNTVTADGAINISLFGASGTVSYQWSNGATTEDLENIEAGEYQLTVTDENLCTIRDTILVPAITTVIADAGTDTSVCYGEEFYLNGLGATSLSWIPAEGLSNPNIGNPLVETTQDAIYILRAEGMNDCYDLDTIQITIFPRLGLNAGNDTTVIESQTVMILTTGGPYISYQWEPATGVDDPTSPGPEIGITQTTTYIVSAETADGCTDRDTITIKLADRLIVYNAFSPNDDGVNDYWDIDYAWLYPDITVEVFNRWGERLFSTKGYTDDKRWDGKYKGTDVPLGTYYYVIVPYPGASALTGPVTVVR